MSANEEETASDAVLEFLDAARFGELDELVRLKDAGVDPSCRDDYGTTALHRAAANGHEDVVKYLLDTCKVNPNATNDSGNTALHWASLNACVEAVKLLLANSALDADAVNKRNQSGVTPLNEAHRKNCEEIEIAMLDFQERRTKGASAKQGTRDSNRHKGDNDDDIADEEIEAMLTSEGDANNLLNTQNSRSATDPNLHGTSAITTCASSSSGTVGGAKGDSTALAEEGSGSSCTVVSGGWFKLSGGLRVFCAEAAPGQDASGAVERTGDTLWSSSIVGALSVSKMAAEGAFSGASVVELGAGCGLLSLAALFGVAILSKNKDVDRAPLSAIKPPTAAISVASLASATQFFVTDADDLALKTSLRNFKRTCVGQMSSKLFHLKKREGWLSSKGPIGLIDDAPADTQDNAQFDSTAYQLICTDGKLCNVAFESMNWAHSTRLARPHSVDVVLGSDLIYELGEGFEESTATEMAHGSSATSIRSTTPNNGAADAHVSANAKEENTSTTLADSNETRTGATDIASVVTDDCTTGNDDVIAAKGTDGAAVGATRRCPCKDTCTAAQLALCIDTMLKKDNPAARLCYFYQPDSLGAEAFIDHLQRRGFDCHTEAVELDRPLEDVLEFCSAEEVRALFPCLSASAAEESGDSRGVLASDFALLTAKRRTCLLANV